MTGRVRMDAHQRLDQIVEQATDLIAEKGYFGFSIGELAQRCGLSNAGLIHHIGSKEQVLHLVLDARDRRDAEALGLTDMYAALTGAQSDDASVDHVVRLLHDLVAHNATQPTMIRLYAILRGEALSAEHPSYAYFRKRDAQAVRAFEAALTGYVRNPHAVARATLALMGGLEEQWLRDPEDVDLVACWDMAFGALLAGSRI
ncbi:helix-turn-helix domain-containing protein [Actinomyces sp. MRS3W]|uniref:TetR/AcrR family transcriptional regulator n=1 Tax=Actinomyces sp. MRS3W TaxID=2800796 RepID=UPI0028FD85DB|nr:helix-turn-helix domain-containing protein [Actinomyces sp. MRS3W]MDU0349487.1 helix-turn-helix domain-containing protein [Actinomyces sp. MRS3W]